MCADTAVTEDRRLTYVATLARARDRPPRGWCGAARDGERTVCPCLRDRGQAKGYILGNNKL